MLKVIYHALPVYVWMGAFLFLMIFSFIPLYFLLMWIANTISKGIELYDVKRGERRATRNNKKNSR